MKLLTTLPKLATISLSGIALMMGTVACSKTQYQNQTYTATAVAAQYTKPKIDILIAQDNSSSMLVPKASLQSQLAGFIAGLNGNWDYHFTVVPLQGTMSINSKWVIAEDCSTMASYNQQYCIPASNAAAFNANPTGNAGWINTLNAATAATDLGFQNMAANLSDSTMTSSGFLRPDAALAVIVLSNGDDVTGINFPSDYTYLNGQNGQQIPNLNSANAVSSFNSFENFMKNLKGSSSLVKFYSVVAQTYHIASQDCNGQYAWPGTRYTNLSAALNSATYDICSGGLSNVLSNISTQLQSLIQAYKFNYAILNGNPIVSSIKVTKNGVTVPQDNTNGWSYVGYTTEYLSYFPANTNQATGYMIKFNGTSVYSGSDVIAINFEKQ